jgi:release factor glutamine methyltransferase
MHATLVSTWTDLRARLAAAGVETPAFDARLLLEAAEGVSRIDILTDPRREVSPAGLERLEALAVRRAAREPLAYILGKQHFWSFVMAVSPAVLTPRPDTETLVRVALELLPPGQGRRILDLGVGSGAVLLAILSERAGDTGLGIDASASALTLAAANAAALGMDMRAAFALGDWGKQLEGTFDLIVSNPPYIEAGAIETLMPEVARYEPRIALDGGGDGLDAYRALAPDVARLLAPGGGFAFEIGQGQGEAVAALAQAAGLKVLGQRADLAGIARVVYGRAN